MSEEVDVGDDDLAKNFRAHRRRYKGRESTVVSSQVAALLDIIREMKADILDLKKRTTTVEYSLRGQIEWRDLLKTQLMQALAEMKIDVRELKKVTK